MERPLKEERVKQGRKGTHLLAILVVGVVLAVAALWIASRFNADNNPPQPGKTLVQGQDKR